MNIKCILSTIAIVAIVKNSFAQTAQYAQDALKFSTAMPGSTARIKAIGNAGTAIGGDLSSISNNPAGIGFFTKSEISITPEFNGTQAKSNYLGQFNSANTNTLNLSDIAGVIYMRTNTRAGKDKTKGLLSLNLGLAYARTNDFYQNTYYAGKNNNNSIGNYYAQLANSPDGVDATTPVYLQDYAYQQYLISAVPGSNPIAYKSNVLPGVSQANTLSRTGGTSEFDLSMGGNVSNTFYFGLGLGFTTVRYNYSKTYIENGTATDPASSAINSFNSVYYSDQSTKGNGFNFKVGAIYKPVEAVRLGFLFTSPTWYNIDDNTSEGLNTQIKGGNFASGAQNYPLTYTFRTPLKVSGGISLFAGSLGFITGDVEYIDYSTIHINDADSYSAQGDNSIIRQQYRSTINVRGGAELRVTPNFMLRGGYGLQGNPLSDYHTLSGATNNDGSSIKTASGGVGYRSNSYYVDVTYANVSGNLTSYPYQIGNNSPTATISNKTNNVFLTVGLRF